jgi:anti-anti-sigma factor
MPELKISACDLDAAPHSAEITVAGNITGNNLPEFEDAVTRALGHKKVIPIINLKDVSYIASTGLAYLVGMVDRMDRFGGMVILIDVNPKIRAIFESLGVDPLFQIAPTREGALALARSQEEVLAAAPRLIEIQGPNEGSEYPVMGGVVSIGSDPRCTLSIKHPQIDRRHSEVYVHDNKVFVKDLGTLFGTYVGNKKVTDQLLNDKDVITVGMFRFEYRAGTKK